MKPPALLSVPARVASWSIHTPDATAVTHDGSAWTYRDLADATAAIGRILDSVGIAPGQTVVVIADRSPVLAAAWLAVLDRGALLMPLDPDLPATRQRQMLTLLPPDHVLTTAATPAPDGFRATRLPGPVTLAANTPGTCLDTTATAHELSGYVAFTSGSTGQPKAIIGRHRSLAHFLDWQASHFDVGPGDRVAHLTSPEFDVALREVFLPLTAGATLCLPPSHLPPGHVLGWLAEERVTLTHAVPTVARAWLRLADSGLELPDLRWLLFGGESLTNKLVDRWRNRFGRHTRIGNLYGPTETTLARTFHEVADPAPAGVQPLGHPIPDSTLWIESGGLRAERSQVGEIIIRTSYGTRGYVGATPDEDARFTQAGDIVEFRTGDLGSIDTDGVLHFHGRTDRQVKIFGVRVLPEAVEAVLEAQDGISHAAVIPTSSDDGDTPRLTAYVVLDDGYDTVPEDLRGTLRRALPSAAIPAEFLPVAALPTTEASGKVNRRSLPPDPRRSCMKTLTRADLETIAEGMRAWVLAANRHPGGSSAVEAVTALYFSDATGLADPAANDRLIWSKGHAVAPWYFALWALGKIPGYLWQDLADFGKLGHPVPRMPRRGSIPAVELSTGSLGQGLSFGIGTALADWRRGDDSRTFVMLGDGECTEGQVWEAAMTAARLGLRNLVALVDANGSGSVIKIPREEWADRWCGFGWRVIEVDGHDVVAVADALAPNESEQPTAVILRTIKGKGLVSDVEGTNTISAEVAHDALPDFDTDALIKAALALIDEVHPFAAQDRREQPSPADPQPPVFSRQTLLGLMTDRPVGSRIVAKKSLAGDLTTELQGLPMLWMAPDAIRNSGILPRMKEVGSWTWSNRTSDVLECAIAEQDAASLAAGAASAGLVPVLCSMEGFYWRMLDQIRQSAVFTGLPVLFVGTSGGLGDLLGPMVQSDGALAALMAIPGLEVFEAADINTAKLLVAEAIGSGKPAYLRLPHEDFPVRASLSALARANLEDGVWALNDEPEPHVVITTAGDMRDVALAAADHLSETWSLSVRVLEVYSPTRMALRSPEQRDELVPPNALSVSIHNAPSSVLRSLLPPGTISLGSDDYGIAGYPLADLYEAAGLTVEALVARISEAV